MQTLVSTLRELFQATGSALAEREGDQHPYLGKPCTSEEMRQAVRRVLDSHAMRSAG